MILSWSGRSGEFTRRKCARYLMKHPVPPVREFNAISDLIDDIRSELRLLLKEEIQLAKTEMSEKLSRLKRNLLLVVAGAAAIAMVAGFQITRRLLKKSG